MLHAVVRGRRGHHVDPSLLVILQGHPHPAQVRLPDRRWALSFDLLWDSTFEEPPGHAQGPRPISVPPHTVLAIASSSVQVYRVPPRVDR